MDPIYWVAIISFIIGACGYIIVRFWIIPIVRYKKTRRLLKASLETFCRKLPNAEEGKAFKKALGKKRLEEIRRQGMKLVEIHDVDLPYWYRLLLLTRKESPLNASEPILKLENMQSANQARRCVAQIGESLAMKLKV